MTDAADIDYIAGEELRQLRARLGYSVRRMSAFAMLVNETGWSKAERTGKIDPARLMLVRAKVELITNGPNAALKVLREIT